MCHLHHGWQSRYVQVLPPLYCSAFTVALLHIVSTAVTQPQLQVMLADVLTVSARPIAQQHARACLTAFSLAAAVMYMIWSPNVAGVVCALL